MRNISVYGNLSFKDKSWLIHFNGFHVIINVRVHAIKTQRDKASFLQFITVWTNDLQNLDTEEHFELEAV